MKSAARTERIRALLGKPEHARLFAAIRRRLEQQGPGSARTVSLAGLSEDERRAVADLHGWSAVPGEGARLTLAKLDQALRESAVGAELVEVVEALTGRPLVNRRQLREQASALHEQRWSEAKEALRDRRELVPWLEELEASGLLTRLARAEGRDERELLDAAIAVALTLPRAGVLLAVLASEVSGDSHALDPGRALSSLVLKAAAQLVSWPAVPARAAGRRQLWAAVGVACDPVSNDVLTLGLRPEGDARLARHLRESSEGGEPRRVTLRELMPLERLAAGAELVFVCENPAIVAAAADRLAGACSPLVCVEGVPSTAGLELLRRLAGAGAALRFHADFDWAGVRIGQLLHERVRAEPWRFGASDYAAAAALGTEPLPPVDSRLDAGWDPELVPRMRELGRAVFEEQVLETLLGDLSKCRAGLPARLST